MGKRLRAQRRGRGTPRYRSPSHRFIGRIKYQKEAQKGYVVDIMHAPGRKTPAAVVQTKKGNELMLAPEAMQIGQMVSTTGTDIGTITEIGNIPEGTKICNIEIRPGDGGKLCRSSGTFATLVSHDKNNTIILLPTKSKKVLPSNCRATIGSIASSGRKDKPFMKAGNKFYSMQALGKLYPHTRGVAMNAMNHPFGGKTKPGKPKSVSRHMPPGKKVGSISPKRVGKKKR
jgi:large subunit ribosomal protein L2